MCSLQVLISHSQSGVQLGLTLKSEMALEGLEGTLVPQSRSPFIICSFVGVSLKA